jgi:hypothetical protein
MGEAPVHSNQEDIERPEQIIDEIDSILGGLKSRFSEAAIHFGQEQERIRQIRPEWENLASNDVTDEDLAKIYASGVNALAAFRDELTDYKNALNPLTGESLRIWPSTGGTISVTSSTTSFLSIKTPGRTSAILEPSYKENIEILEKLRAIDPALEKTYSAIREVLFGTVSDPERGALYLIRQTFDHFFSTLSPDDLVRSSRFFKPKEGQDKDRVTRHERLIYAAHTYIRNISRRNALTASYRHMLNLYDSLNKAHTRGSVDPEKAQMALREMVVLLQDWVRSIDLPPFA